MSSPACSNARTAFHTVPRETSRSRASAEPEWKSPSASRRSTLKEREVNTRYRIARMTIRKRHILAIGGMALPAELDNLRLVKYFLEQTGRTKPKVLYIGTATGDA